jgi:hypothetical protein
MLRSRKKPKGGSLIIGKPARFDYGEGLLRFIALTLSAAAPPIQ